LLPEFLLIDQSIKNNFAGRRFFMPKVGMEPLRRRALIDATISAIGERGSLDVTMSEIAGRAGVSSALAHHYFGAKDELLQATMRHLLAELNADTRCALGAAQTPRGRVSAVIAVSFSDKQFQPETIAAWLSFYVEAQKSTAPRRLLRVYARRLHSNLMSGLATLLPRTDADHAAEGIAALIDGLYIRRALKDGTPNAASAIALVEDYLETRLSGFPDGRHPSGGQ
jgi:TetR/AcrR family transcriptional repressor of bet genes